MSKPLVYLASTSPRRVELLSQLNIPFETVKINVPEILQPGEEPKSYVLRLAKAKSMDGVINSSYDLPVIGADTIGFFEGGILEKPKNEQDAVEMLSRLSGKTHEIYTGLCVSDLQKSESILISSQVTFRHLSLNEINRYVDSGEPLDKSGAYGIQGLAGSFVQQINGNYQSIIGLPLSYLVELLKKFNITM